MQRIASEGRGGAYTADLPLAYLIQKAEHRDLVHVSATAYSGEGWRVGVEGQRKAFSPSLAPLVFYSGKKVQGLHRRVMQNLTRYQHGQCQSSHMPT